ncbi:DUF1028 domain-containing protein [Mycolicibacterium diernhoferi]|uniref:DUF1028 domain-containing protein n=1 Tax=Mycolicibacterium diernhoferi TaxID=1801 RepID=A0A1Q4H8V2_9MYCO|nr:DUF1028 domain-containing protein [Mycolicibacterium diernhoferi]OJZ63947.1 fimbrial assembly protein FimA [Mycolicibacterium diernhoferi]OPE55988.1 fimbrial assembly protein FimA [Mycolicibacterium diernhoferi]PEG55670.1 DUF1028 domain-containing protein [Mycolicibacterium diernhoferi]QYL20632.1 DUF1028 domain-containing protein [Mycolicibacterium diernhoferi]
MTFSLAALDRDTGAFGMVIASSSPAVASRCLNIRPGLGAAASQNVTDPRLGPLLLDQLAAGADARTALDTVVEAHPMRDYRQLTVLDRAGRSAAFSGAGALGTHHHLAGDGVVGAGNMLASAATITELVRGYETSAATQFERRLLDGLAAALDAGGEEGPIHAAGLLVYREVEWPETTLRVDWSEDPYTQLAALWEVWEPQRDDYVRRALDPAGAPSFGVPGDL